MAAIADPDRLLLLAASSATGVATDLIEMARDPGDLANALRTQECAESLANALQAVLEMEFAGVDPDPLLAVADAERAQLAGPMLAACRRFLEGWA